MKKFYLLFIVAIMALSCSDDDSVARMGEEPASIAGVWRSVKIVDAFGEEDINTGCPDNSGAAHKIYLLRDDNTFNYFNICNASDLNVSGTYIYSDGVLSLQNQISTEPLTVVLLTETEMHIRQDYEITPGVIQSNHIYLERQE